VRSATRSRLGIFFVAAGFFVLFVRAPGQRGTPFAGWPASRTLVAIVAVLLFLAGCALITWAIRTLGKQWSFSARTVEGHQLVTRGPFAVVRNPIYASIGLVVVAAGLTVATPVRLAIALMLYLAGTFLRIRAEEELMRATFGAQWDEYRQRVPALFPRL
jgi:protein-S-isoprenylcysteine O-methyltransferase Ste14